MKMPIWVLASVSAIALATALPVIAADPAPSVTTRVSDVKAADLIGQTVKNAANETVGEIDSVILDKDGRTQAVVLSAGGFLGMGERLVAVDWSALTITQGGKDVRMNVTKEAMKGYPEFRYRESKWRGTTYYDSEYHAQASKPVDLKPNDHDLRSKVSASDVYTPTGSLKISGIIGETMVDLKQDAVGKIEDIVISPDGQIHALVSVGGFIGMGDRMVLIKWSDVKINRKNDDVQFQISKTKDDLKSMPDFKANS